MIIAFVGNDGSGKTTMSRHIQRFFSDLGFDAMYKHEYDYAVLGFLFKIVGEEKIQKARNEMLVQRKRSATYTLWPMLVWFDLLLQYVYYRIFKMRSVIVLDRYPYDQYLSFKYLGVAKRLTEWFYLRFPKPDICITLTVKPEIAFERKKDTHSYSLQFYQKQTQEYLNLAQLLKVPIVNTDSEFRQSAQSVLFTICRNPSIFDKVLKKGIQNRVIFQKFKEYGIHNPDTTLDLRLWTEQEKRRNMFRKSIECINDLLQNSIIDDYVIIKTIDDFGFVGNDIDILVSPQDFQHIMKEDLKSYIQSGIQRIKYDTKKDAGKMDIFVQDGLTLDIHSYIGWGNVIFLDFSDVRAYVDVTEIFGIECKVINEKVNSVIMLAHSFEKGFLTKDEANFIDQHFDEQYFREKFPRLSKILDEHLGLVLSIFNEPRREFPVFLSLLTFVKCYLRLSAPSKPEKVKTFTRDFLRIMFWKVRYYLLRRLPFEVSLDLK